MNRRDLSGLELAIAIATIILFGCLAGTLDRPAPAHLGPHHHGGNQ